MRVVFRLGVVCVAFSGFVGLPSKALSSDAAKSPFSKERLQRVEHVLQGYINQNQLAGVVALVLQNGKPIYQKALGWRDKETNTPMTMDTLFRIASQTKAITSAAVLILSEEGKIALDDPVSRYIPAFEKTSVAIQTEKELKFEPAKRPITVRDLLTHTSGISYGNELYLEKLYAEKQLGKSGVSWRLMDLNEPVCTTMERLATLPFSAHPGEKWVYGYNTDVLGCVVERASGMSLNSFILKKITGPLGMNDTSFFLSPDQASRLATVYVGGDKGITSAPDGPGGQGTFVKGPKVNFAGGAGLISTAKDYARFLEMIRKGGSLDGVQVLSPRSVALMTTNQVGSLHNPLGLGFGLGFETTDRYGANDLDSIGAFGWGGAYGTAYRVDPVLNLVWVLMLQELPPRPSPDFKFPTMLYQALLK